MNEPSAVRRARPLRRAAPWCVAALLLASVGLPVAAGTFGHLPNAPSVGYARPFNSTTLVVNMTDTPRFVPQFLSAAAGDSATFHLVNQGTIAHSFTLLRQPGVRLNSSWTPAQIDQYITQNGSLANVSVPGGGQANATVAFNASTAFDSFEFVSLVPYQFQAGMFGFLNLTSTAPGLETFENTTDSYTFVPDALAANDTHYPFNLDVLVTNTGNFGHTFTIASQSNVTLSPANFTSYFQQHAPLASVTLAGGAGSTVWANFTVPGPGVYQYICEVPGHFAAGMTGFLYVGVPVPPQPGPPSTAIVESWVLVGSAALLGVGLFAAILSAYMGRFPDAPKDPSEHH
ncbi:MAG: plastocyanin/azurin family copper-binding protein [Thermoplasmata archaeon]|nr:plastocyanin/azurin family copper-binding protein [Thermoplasmata archaeon]